MAYDTLLVTGSRDWKDEATIHHWLLHASQRFDRLVHGGAKGADSIAGTIGRKLGMAVVKYSVSPCDGPWPSAGPRRNQRMIDSELANIGRAIAFVMPVPGRNGVSLLTRGTGDCVGRLMTMGIPVTIVTTGSTTG